MITEATIQDNARYSVSMHRSISAAGPDDEKPAIATITMGFSTDPIARWAYPEAGRYLETFPEFVRAFGGRAFEHGSAFVNRELTGAALWLPPGVVPDEESMSELIERTTSAAIQRDLFPVLEQMGNFHPHEPHWYLPMIGVDTFCQGNGIGSALMKRAVQQCDSDGLPAYLESSNPKNISLYQRFGFEILGIIQHGASPPMFPMIRQPRAASNHSNN